MYKKDGPAKQPNKSGVSVAAEMVIFDVDHWLQLISLLWQYQCFVCDLCFRMQLIWSAMMISPALHSPVAPAPTHPPPKKKKEEDRSQNRATERKEKKKKKKKKLSPVILNWFSQWVNLGPVFSCVDNPNWLCLFWKVCQPFPNPLLTWCRVHTLGLAPKRQNWILQLMPLKQHQLLPQTKATGSAREWLLQIAVQRSKQNQNKNDKEQLERLPVCQNSLWNRKWTPQQQRRSPQWRKHRNHCHVLKEFKCWHPPGLNIPTPARPKVLTSTKF